MRDRLPFILLAIGGFALGIACMTESVAWSIFLTVIGFTCVYCGAGRLGYATGWYAGRLFEIRNELASQEKQVAPKTLWTDRADAKLN